MPVEAPVSKFRKTNLKIYIAVCIAFVIWCVYDAHFNETFREKYTDADGKPMGWLVVNQKAPPYLAGVALLLVGYLFATRKSSRTKMSSSSATKKKSVMTPYKP